MKQHICIHMRVEIQKTGFHFTIHLQRGFVQKASATLI